jgi:hypothetical protein
LSYLKLASKNPSLIYVMHIYYVFCLQLSRSFVCFFYKKTKRQTLSVSIRLDIFGNVALSLSVHRLE